MIRWLASLFAWREAFRSGVYAYEENAITGERRYHRCRRGGYSPLDIAWLSRLRP
jgi:hypothetical protein